MEKTSSNEIDNLSVSENGKSEEKITLPVHNIATSQSGMDDDSPKIVTEEKLKCYEKF